ncbi:tetratricopeptide repeat protein [Mariniflexile rhizosphaerae]|uniref:tetratricopeptide repeat protein n=1 Tax=unclassified Mariniflexile TaxID=2643887 RepID=UPI000CCAC3D9|nr:tetratricopeptide repeat protein [Mariniflexile sp. TRM1-10]AXP80547.1 tetratricopeptide repeat protein [Mariniflexile sp. TRM1-10]PLB20089.1 MAG: TPR domain protein [Flavobacteriaceae bacterium FS1-H7996/R]
MKQKIYILILLFGILIFPQVNYAQVDFNKKPDDDLGNVEDKFQELFYEALKQKGIENYDRSVDALLKCIELDNSVPVLYYELGKNYMKLKNFGAAEDALKKAVSKAPDNEWFLDALYGFYMEQSEFDKAIKTVKQLVKFHTDYKENLAALYVKTKEYKDALKILDELDAEFGISVERDFMRNQIYEATGRKKDQIKNLEARVEDNPDKESNYLQLIFRYSENNEQEKAFETAKELLKINPNSQIVHLALYKFYLDDNNAEKAIESMKIVVKSPEIKPEAKLKVLTDFVQFVGNNPQYEADLVEATALVDNSNSSKTLTELGQYYLVKSNKPKALEYFESALKIDGENFNVLRNVLLLYIDLQKFNLAEKKSYEVIQKYPAQPLFYLINGVALNQLNQPKKAADVLETGLDFIIDDNKMEIDFYNQLSISYSLLSNTAKAKAFSDKVKQLETSN